MGKMKPRPFLEGRLARGVRHNKCVKDSPPQLAFNHLLLPQEEMIFMESQNPQNPPCARCPPAPLQADWFAHHTRKENCFSSTLLELLSFSLCSSCKSLPSKAPAHTPTFLFQPHLSQEQKEHCAHPKNNTQGHLPADPRGQSPDLSTKGTFPAIVSNSQSLQLYPLCFGEIPQQPQEFGRAGAP